jgi:WXG100 family type VII secretion target
MMTLLKLETVDFREIIESIKAQHIEIDSVLDNLRALNARLEGTWEGNARVEFETTYSNWIQQLDNYSETLNSVTGYLESVLTNYEALDEAARQAAAGAAMPQ